MAIDKRFLFNCTVEYRPDSTGRKLLLPGLADENNDVVIPLLKYSEYLFDKGYSQSLLSKVREAVRLFYEYSFVNIQKDGFGAGEKGAPNKVEHWRHFVRFRAAIVFGTVDPKTGKDPSQLYWAASGVTKGNRVATLLTGFFSYLDELDGGNRATRYNPTISSSAYESLARAAAYEHKRAKALLGHTWERAQDSEHGSNPASSVSRIKKASSEPPRMSDFQFDQLLENGFDLNEHNGLRDALIAILMNKAGLRESEALHLWTVDIVEDPVAPSCALIKVVHPDVGPCNLSYRGKKFKTRGEYLRSVYGLEPRTSLVDADPQKLGWKARFDVLRVWWFPTWWGIVFWRLWRRYLNLTATKRSGHPYAFVMEHERRWSPLTEDAYRKAYERAVFRAGLVPAGGCGMKAAGLTPHGGRHAYGNRAKNEADLDRKVVMVMMHHATDEAQDVYTRQGISQVRSDLAEAMERMRHRGKDLELHTDAELEGLPSRIREMTLGCS